MKASVFAVVGTASLASVANAGFMGFVGSVRTVGAYTVIDVFAGVSNSSDKFLNVYNLNASTTVAGGFYQAPGTATKGWRPATGVPWQTRNALDSFMTAGTFGGGAYAGEYFASTNTNADPNFLVTPGAWNPTLGSAPATTIPVAAGWYTGDPTSPDNNAESLAGLVGRVNGTGAQGAQWGIWVGHLVLAGTNVNLSGPNTNVFWTAVGSAKDGVTGAVTSATSAIPAPGAIALVGLAAACSRRRRN